MCAELNTCAIVSSMSGWIDAETSQAAKTHRAYVRQKHSLFFKREKRESGLNGIN